MTYIVLSFDVEDYVNPHAADGILRCAELLRRHGVRGAFNVVGYLATALEAWGRQDVIDALRYHEIETHSLAHSMHPTINEYTDLEDFDEALSEFLRRETEARDILYRVFGVRHLPAGCPPGNSVSYVAHYGYAEMGIPFYAGDALVDPVRGRPLFYCNMLTEDYHTYMERFLFQWSHEEILAHLDRIAETNEVYVIAHHPQLGYIAEFCDERNFKGENTPPEQYRLSPLRPAEEIEHFYQQMEFLVTALLNDPRFRIVTYEELNDIYDLPRAPICRETVAAVAPQLRQHLFPVTLPDSYCLCDLALGCRDLLLGQKEHICGKVFGFLDTPYSISEAVTLTREEVRLGADEFRDGDFLPLRVRCGEKVIGPADWLRAALSVLEGADEVTLQPGDWQIDMDQFSDIKNMSLKNTWVHSSEFEDRFISHRLRLQSWTIRLPKGGPRLILE